MSLSFEIPGDRTIELTDLVLDVNGTLTNRGALIDGVRPRLLRLRSRCSIHLVSADTFGTLEDLASLLEVSATRVASGVEKLDFVNRRGADHCGVIGNGVNDAMALQAAALGVVVLGPEGMSPQALQEADVLCASITDALDLLDDPRALAATIRP
jgi:soluble P-type ATPase